MNYLKLPYDVQAKISSYAQQKWYNDWYIACVDRYHDYSYDA